MIELDSEPDTDNEELPIDGSSMSLMDHLGELRTRLFKSFATILVLFVVAMTFSTSLIEFLKIPLLRALPEGSRTLHFTGPLDVLLASLKVSFLSAVVLGCPLWLYQFWKFFEPGLYRKERKFILPFTIASMLLFLAGTSFCFFIILPMTLEFLIGIGLKVGVAIITINDYLSMVLILIFGFGIIFETPLILVLLALLDIISAKSLSEFRPFAIVAILITGALLTPPDPLSQIAMAVPVYLMYEISIVVIKILKREKNSVPKTSP